jgi:predicted lysophospholipase L1 biosynthesis ABC-type transport system permease subunit
VPEPVPALVSGADDKQFDGPGLEDNVHMSVVGRLPRVPGAPPGSRVVDLEGLLRRPGTEITNDVVQVWSDDAGAIEEVKSALREHGAIVGRVTTIDGVRAELDASPAAWSLALSVLVGGAAVLVAMLVMIVATATTWRARATDLAALRMAGLPGRSLRRMELLGQLPVVLVGAVAGAVCGIVAAVIALPGVRQFTDPPAVTTTDFATPWAVVVAASLVALLLLTGLGVATARWTASRASLNRIREVV